MAGMALIRTAIWAGRARTISLWVVAVLVAIWATLLVGAKPAYADTFIVNSTGDQKDTNTGDGKCRTGQAVIGIGELCTLRAAIEQANATAGADTMRFNISGSGVKTIKPGSSLPVITATLTIDGYTQRPCSSNPEPCSSPNTRAKGTNAKLLIELDGTNIDATGGLSIDHSAPNSVIKGLVINRSTRYGIFVAGGTTGTIVQGNFIGTDASGTAVTGTQTPNNLWGGVGIGGQTGGGNIIGGPTPAARNLISGNQGTGIEVFSPGNRVLGNLIGTGKDATTPVGNSGNGVSIFGAAGNAIGGSAAAHANVIAFNGFDGVAVFGDESIRNRILRNSIFSNDGFGMDLDGDGPSPNDVGDGDSGPNGLQNKPVLISAVTSPRATLIRGRLSSKPDKTFTIQFFSNPSGNEGKTFIGEETVVTDNTGTATFAFTPPKLVAVGQRVTATATGGEGTSEFSAPRAVTAP